MFVLFIKSAIIIIRNNLRFCWCSCRLFNLRHDVRKRRHRFFSFSQLSSFSLSTAETGGSYTQIMLLSHPIGPSIEEEGKKKLTIDFGGVVSRAKKGKPEMFRSRQEEESHRKWTHNVFEWNFRLNIDFFFRSPSHSLFRLFSAFRFSFCLLFVRLFFFFFGGEN